MSFATRKSDSIACLWVINALVTFLIKQATIDIVNRSNIIYAALFCYRQSIELFMEHLIELFGKGKMWKPKNTLDLSRLWEKFMCIVNDRNLDESIGLVTVEKIVTEMLEADKKSDGFRYPTGVDGSSFLFSDRGH